MGKIEINKRRMSVKDLLVNGGDQTPLQTRQPVSLRSLASEGKVKKIAF